MMAWKIIKCCGMTFATKTGKGKCLKCGAVRSVENEEKNNDEIYSPAKSEKKQT